MLARRAAIAVAAAVATACVTQPPGRDGGHFHDHEHVDVPLTGFDVPVVDAPTEDGAIPPAWVWDLPPGFPVPFVPDDNPMSHAKVELGRHLFYDTRLSGNETQACASCHDQARAFTDGAAVSLGSTGDATPRNSMSLFNVGYFSTFTWGNPLLLSLESQAQVPLLGMRPIELGAAGREVEVLDRLRDEPRYAALFPRAFPDETADPFSIANVTRALAAFQRSMVAGGSPFDRRVYRGEMDAMTPAAVRGLTLFNSERLECFHCHNGFLLSDAARWEGSAPTARFHNTGLYNVGGDGSYPAPNTGVHEISGEPADMGRFRAPSLRNVAVTAPYMHDGSIATLSEVLDHYAAGGRTIASGPHAGVGSASPYRSELVPGFVLTEEERADVIAFLEALTDEGALNDPRFADPWDAPCAACEP